MDLRKLAQKQIQKAFKLAGTLAITVVLTKNKPTTFDFASGEATDVESGSLTIKGIPEKASSKGRSLTPQQVESQTMLFISAEIGNPDLYTRAEFLGKTWKPVPPFLDDGYVTTITFNKEK